ncbi:MAG TPA: hypothetical protein VGW57_00415 [Chthoniobacterales bacterium]|nr:hypothetical protein [Chthoniobacterales bacterium]
MNASELEQIWKRQNSLEPTPENIAQVAAAVHSVDQKFRRKIWWRDVREVGAALVIAAVFAINGRTSLRWIAVASCLFVAGFIIRSRIAAKSRAAKVSVVDRLRQMIRETEIQIRLLRTVLWWYLLPLGAATIIMVLDRAAASGRPLSKFDPAFLTRFLSVMGVFYLAVYWLNQHAVRKHLEPRRASLENALAEVRELS